MKKILLLFVAMLSLNAIAQSEINEGVITSKMTMSSSNEQMNAQLAMVGDIPITTYFKGQKSRTEQVSQMIGNNTSIVDNSSKKILVLMDNPMVGGKKFNKIDIKAPKKEFIENVKVSATGDIKTIAGYVCKGYEIKVKEGGNERKMTMYTTDKIKAPTKDTAEFGDKIKGFPMLTIVNIDQGGMPLTVTMEVTAVKAEKVDDSKFDMTVPEGYSKMEKPKAPAMVD